QMAGSTDVITLHGDINRHKCFDDCQGDPTLVDVSQLTWDHESGPPHCPHCGAYVRPDVVWFTERLPLGALSRAEQLTDSADVMLVIGTSGMVQPAALLPYRAKRYADAYLIDLNPNEDEIAAFADLHIAAPSGEALPLIVEAMRKIP
ncbi:MAG TPA: Sir2 family NAD-dependent protein deacetylase, partial [Aggregatilineales bacterium]|nr:Sir2 family NAD-dependent protein deacetylase [Aggregatilineales bacterium]